MNRINERKTCFEIIFTFSFDTNKSIDEIIEVYKETNELEELSDYVLNTVNGVFENLQVIDEKIKTSIKGRKFERLDNVCLTSMRYATYELLFNDDIPDRVAINEAIEITKKYDDSLSAFVHGNLAIIANGKNE